MRRLVLLLLAVLLPTMACATDPSVGWPVLPAPAGAVVQWRGDEVQLDGRPSRLQRFTVAQAEPAVHRFYQQQFGARRVENRVDGAQVVATRRGAYFHTVQLRALDTQRTQVTVLTTLLGDGLHRAPAPPSLNLLPVSTVPLSTLETRDGGQAALTLVAANRHSVQANRDHLVDALQAKGFRLQHELDAGPAGPAGVVLVFASSTQEVIVNVREAGEFRSIVIQQMQAAR